MPIIGAASCSLYVAREGTMELMSLGTRRAHLRQGWATKLMLYCQLVAKANDCHIELFVDGYNYNADPNSIWPDNIWLQKWYERLGFIPFERYPNQSAQWMRWSV